MDATSNPVRRDHPGAGDGPARQDVLVAIVAAVTGANREQILEEFADYPGRLRDFRDEVLTGGPLWARLARGRRVPDRGSGS